MAGKKRKQQTTQRHLQPLSSDFDTSSVSSSKKRSRPPKLHQQEHKLISSDLSSKILKEALNQQKEILEEETRPQTLTSFSSIPPNHSIASDSGAESDDDVDAFDGFSETLSHYDAPPEEIDEEDEKVLAAFMSKDAGPQRTLADLIIQRIKEKDAQVTSVATQETFFPSFSCFNVRASEFPREYDGACLQMRMSYSLAAHLFLFLAQWTDCSLAGALGLLRVLIYKVYVDGTTTMSVHERKASIKEFYAVIFPSLLQLQSGIMDMENRKQKAVCMERCRRRDDEERRQYSEIEAEREEESGICMELNSKIVLPNCIHAMCMKCYTMLCMKCYREWHSRSQSCPFCRDSLKRVNSGDLWIFTDSKEVIDMATLSRET